MRPRADRETAASALSRSCPCSAAIDAISGLALKHHPAVYDALVVGRSSERWGQEVVAVVRVRGSAEVSDSELVATAAKHLARFKLPKAIVRVDHVRRSASGKPDYAWARDVAAAAPVSERAT